MCKCYNGVSSATDGVIARFAPCPVCVTPESIEKVEQELRDMIADINLMKNTLAVKSG